MIRTVTETRRIRLSTDTAFVEFDIGDTDACLIEVEPLTGSTWGAAELAVHDSGGGRVFTADPDLDALNAAAPILRSIDCSGRGGVLRVVVTTPHASAGQYADVHLVKRVES